MIATWFFGALCSPFQNKNAWYKFYTGLHKFLAHPGSLIGINTSFLARYTYYNSYLSIKLLITQSFPLPTAPKLLREIHLLLKAYILQLGCAASKTWIRVHVFIPSPAKQYEIYFLLASYCHVEVWGPTPPPQFILFIVMSRRARAKRTELDADNEGGGTHGVQVGLRPCGVDPAPGDVVMPWLTRGTVSSAPPPLSNPVHPCGVY